MDDTEFLLHQLRLSLDNLHKRMQWEQSREEPDNHYHYVENAKCVKPACAGVDPALATSTILRDALVAIEKEFPGSMLSVRHIP